MIALLLATVVNEHATVTLRAPSEIEVGRPAELRVEFQVKPHWHIYWENPGDSGEEPRATWTAAPDLKFGRFEMPIPARLPAGPFTNFGYAAEDSEGKPRAIPFRVKVEAAKPELKSISLSLTYLVCKESCVPEKAELQVSVPVVAQAKPASSAVTATLPTDEMPLPIREGAGSRGEPLVSVFSITPPEGADAFADLKIPPAWSDRDISALRFFPLTTPALQASDAGQPSGTMLRVMLEGSISAQNFPGKLEGLIVDEARGDAVWVEFLKDSPFDAAAFFKTIGLAILGGLLLNLMPCVFPVVSLKILSFVREGNSEPREIRKHAYAYAVGILVSLWSLVALLLMLRSAGTLVGWGFQLQNPIFIFVMLAVFFLLGLNLLGVLEINYAGPSRLQNLMMKRGLSGSFFTGLLTTVVATPCSAPFMGVAVGSALAGTFFEAFSIFTALAIGLALPYLVLALNPKWISALPKPGRWMETLKEFLAFPLFLTSVWLFWVLAQMVEVGALIPVLGWCVAAGFFAWAYSRNVRWQGWRMWLGLSTLLLIVATALSIGTLTGSTLTARAPVAATSESEDWGRYSDERLKTELARGKTVFVDFTASWCVTCQINKRLVLTTESGNAAFQAQSVVKLRADWTKRDSEITNALSRLGRNSVPVYALYRKGSAQPVLLPEILTLDILKSALEEK